MSCAQINNDDDLPFYDKEVGKYDTTKVVVAGAEAVGGSGRGRGRGRGGGRGGNKRKWGQGVVNEASGVGPEAGMSIVPVPGYVGKPKGLKQVLYERGLYKPDANGKYPTLAEMKVILGGHTDFLNEIGILEEIMVLRGHILLMSPKCHPEIAGCAIEYLWGYSKQRFRRL